MKTWSEWEITRHQVAIGGRVIDERELPVAGAEVTLTDMPDEFRRKISGTPETAKGARIDPDQRLDLSFTKPDGIYYFLDLPAGEYTVKGADRRSGAAAEKSVSVSWSKDGKVAMAVADLKLSHARRR